MATACVEVSSVPSSTMSSLSSLIAPPSIVSAPTVSATTTVPPLLEKLPSIVITPTFDASSALPATIVDAKTVLPTVGTAVAPVKKKRNKKRKFSSKKKKKSKKATTTSAPTNVTSTTDSSAGGITSPGFAKLTMKHAFMPKNEVKEEKKTEKTEKIEAYVPMAFQEKTIQDIVNSAMKNGFGKILADEMGLGKTSQMLESLRRMLTMLPPALYNNRITWQRNNLVYLILAPKSVVRVWAKEAAFVSSSLGKQVVICSETLKAPRTQLGPDARILITTPGLLRTSGWEYVESLLLAKKETSNDAEGTDAKDTTSASDAVDDDDEEEEEKPASKKGSKKKKSSAKSKASSGSKRGGKGGKSKGKSGTAAGKAAIAKKKAAKKIVMPWFYNKVWEGVVIDEAHDALANGIRQTGKGLFRENFKMKTAQSIYHLKYRCSWLLTGTPIKNKISDLVALAKFLLTNKHPLGNIDNWITHSKEEQEQLLKKFREKENFLIRNDDRVLGLEPIKKVIIECEMSPAQRRSAHQDMHTTLGYLKKMEQAKGVDKAKYHMAILAMIGRLRLNNNSPLLLKTYANADAAEIDRAATARRSKGNGGPRGRPRKRKNDDDSDGAGSIGGDATIDDDDDDDVLIGLPSAPGGPKPHFNGNSNDRGSSSTKTRSSSKKGSSSSGSEKKEEEKISNEVNNSASDNGITHPPWPKMSREEILESSPKLRKVLELSEEKLSRGEQVLIFSFSVQTLKLLARLFTLGPKIAESSASIRAGKELPIFTGKTSTEEREQMINAFQAGREKILLLSSKAGGLGITLTAATHVILLDPWWHPFVEFQAIKRAHRKGQTKTVHMYRFFVREAASIDVWMFGLQQQKLLEAQSILPDLARYSDCFVLEGKSKVNLVSEFKKWIVEWVASLGEEVDDILQKAEKGKGKGAKVESSKGKKKKKKSAKSSKSKSKKSKADDFVVDDDEDVADEDDEYEEGDDEYEASSDVEEEEDVEDVDSESGDEGKEEKKIKTKSRITSVNNSVSAPVNAPINAPNGGSRSLRPRRGAAVAAAAKIDATIGSDDDNDEDDDESSSSTPVRVTRNNGKRKYDEGIYREVLSDHDEEEEEENSGSDDDDDNDGNQVPAVKTVPLGMWRCSGCQLTNTDDRTVCPMCSTTRSK